MTIDRDNPYAAPETSSEPENADLDATGDVLASRWIRFVGFIIDQVLATVVMVPLGFVIGLSGWVAQQPNNFVDNLQLQILGLIVSLMLNGYLLVKRGQTIAKYILGIQIVSYQTGERLGFTRVYVLRDLWLVPLMLLTTLIPGVGALGWVGFPMMIEVLFIFGPQRRCLHDYIAGSKVVQFKPDRQKATSAKTVLNEET